MWRILGVGAGAALELQRPDFDRINRITAGLPGVDGARFVDDGQERLIRKEPTFESLDEPSC
jgi:hypothetical protein